MSDPAPEKSPAASAAGSSAIAVPRADFDSVPGRRASYIIAYGLYIALIFGPKVLVLAGLPPPLEGLGFILFGVGLVGFVVFAYHFTRAARTMGFEVWIASGVVVIALSAFPGPLLLAYMDRKIAIAWDAADPSGGYRRRPPADEVK